MTMALNALPLPPDDLKTNIGALYENLVGNQGASKFQLTLKKSEAVYHLWSFAHASDEKRMVVCKAGCLPHIASELESDCVYRKHVALGCLCSIAESDDCLVEILTTCNVPKIIAVATNVLLSDHYRSIVPAAGLLALISKKDTLVSALKESIPGLVKILGLHKPRWAQLHLAHAHSARALKSLASCLSPEGIPMFTEEIHSCGATVHLLTLLDMGAEGTKTAASECLRSLSLHKPVITCLGEQHNLQAIVEAIPFALMEQKVHLMAIISEISYLENGAEKILNSGALPSLASIVKNAGSEIAAKSKKASVGLPHHLDQATLWALGALWNLSQIDEVKLFMGKLCLIPHLVWLLRSKNSQITQYAQGILWQLGLEQRNRDALISANAPKFLVKPIPTRWLPTYANPMVIPGYEPSYQGFIEGESLPNGSHSTAQGDLE